MATKPKKINELPEGQRGKGKIIAMMNNKGGCGKTTTSIALGLYLARTGHNVLFADCDPQHNLTQRLGIGDDRTDIPRFDSMFYGGKSIDYCFTRVMTYKGLQRVKGIECDEKGIIGLLPGSLTAEGAAGFMEFELGTKSREEKERLGYQSLDHFMQSYFQRLLNFYEYIIVDTAPALEGNKINIAIAKLIDTAIIPIDGIEAALGIRRLTGFLSKQNPFKKPNTFFAMVKYQNDLRTPGITQDLRARNAVYRNMTEVFDGYVCSKGVQETPKYRMRKQGGRGSVNNLPGFGGKTDYTLLSQELETMVNNVNRPSLLDHIEKNAEVMRGFEVKMSALAASVLKHKPMDKAVSYISEAEPDVI